MIEGYAAQKQGGHGKYISPGCSPALALALALGLALGLALVLALALALALAAALPWRRGPKLQLVERDQLTQEVWTQHPWIALWLQST